MKGGIIIAYYAIAKALNSYWVLPERPIKMVIMPVMKKLPMKILQPAENAGGRS